MKSLRIPHDDLFSSCQSTTGSLKAMTNTLPSYAVSYIMLIAKTDTSLRHCNKTDWVNFVRSTLDLTY